MFSYVATSKFLSIKKLALFNAKPCSKDMERSSCNSWQTEETLNVGGVDPSAIEKIFKVNSDKINELRSKVNVFLN